MLHDKLVCWEHHNTIDWVGLVNNASSVHNLGWRGEGFVGGQCEIFTTRQIFL